MAIIKKREASSQKQTTTNNWVIEMNYERFIWFYLHPSFSKVKSILDIKEKKGESIVLVAFKEDSDTYMDFDKDIKSLDHRYC